LVAVPTFQIHIVNSDFEATNSLEAPDLEAAWKEGLKGALEIGAEEVSRDLKPFFGAEVRIAMDGEVKKRFVVGIGQSPLQ
jgi:hypothetical protein